VCRRWFLDAPPLVPSCATAGSPRAGLNSVRTASSAPTSSVPPPPFRCPSEGTAGVRDSLPTCCSAFSQVSARRRDQQHVGPHLRLLPRATSHATVPGVCAAAGFYYSTKQLSFRSKLLLNQERADTREKQQQGSSRLLNREAEDERACDSVCYLCMVDKVSHADCICVRMWSAQPVRANVC
jgi:hypothetical protein